LIKGARYQIPVLILFMFRIRFAISMQNIKYDFVT